MKFFRFSMSLLYLLLLIQSLSFSQADMKSDVTELQIDSLFASWDDQAKPGIAVGVVVNGEVKHLRGYGSANLEHNVPITPSTKFQYVGMSDQIVAFAVLLLEERGSLDLDDKIRQFIPSLPKSMDGIKLHHLLNHTSGLYDLSVLRQFAGWQSSDEFTSEQKDRLLRTGNNIEAKPGQKYLSTNMEARLLQDIIEVVTNQTLNEFATEAIFNPLGMSNSLFAETATQLIENRAQGYYGGDGAYELAQSIKDAGQTDLLYSTVEDMSKWAQNFSTHRVGSKELFRQFESFVTVDGTKVDMENTSQYIGQHRYWNFNGTKKLYLIGMQSGYACKLVRFPDQDLSVVVMGNGGSYNGHWSSFVAELYLKHYFETREQAPPVKEESYSMRLEQLENYIGSYWNDEDLYTTEVSFKNDTLRYFEEEFNWRMNLIPVEDNLFTTSRGHMIEFDNSNGLRKLNLTMPTGAKTSSLEYEIKPVISPTIQAYVGSYSNASIGAGFNIEMEGEELVVSHLKLGKHKLIPVGHHTFKTNQRLLKQLRFVTNKNGVQQIEMTNSSVKNYPFSKESIEVLK